MVSRSTFSPQAGDIPDATLKNVREDDGWSRSEIVPGGQGEAA